MNQATEINHKRMKPGQPGPKDLYSQPVLDLVTAGEDSVQSYQADYPYDKSCWTVEDLQSSDAIFVHSSWKIGFEY